MEVLDFILDFIVEEGIIMIPVLYVVAEIIKGANLIIDNLIPPLLLILSLGFTPLLLGGYTADNVVQAVLVVGGAVLANQLYKQTKKMR